MSANHQCAHLQLGMSDGLLQCRFNCPRKSVRHSLVGHRKLMRDTYLSRMRPQSVSPSMGPSDHSCWLAKAFSFLLLLCCLANPCLAECWSAVSVHMCRPVPTRPSHYASGVLQPLRALLDTDAGKRLQPLAQEELAQVFCYSCSSLTQKQRRLQHDLQRHSRHCHCR